MKNLVKVLSLIFCMVALAMIVQAQDLPKPVGFVNDFADKLKPQEHQQLEDTVQNYKKKTGIEFAIVTEDSLNGGSEFDRSLAYARSWGVGEKETGNGLLLYIAFKEHKYFMQVSRHLEGDLTDGQAGQIQREHLVPHFRKNEWAAGITETVDAIIAQLGDATTVERDRLRQERAIQEQQQQEQEARENAIMWQKFKHVMAYVIPSFFVIGLPFFLFMQIRKRRRELEEQKGQVRSILNKSKEYIQTARANEVQTSKALSTLRELAPQYAGGKLEQRVKGQSQNFSELQKTLDELNNQPLKKRDHVALVLFSAQKILSSSKDASELLETINDEIARVTDAKQQSELLFGTLPNRIARTGDKLSLPSVPVSCRTKVDEARDKLKEAEQKTRETFPDWLVIYAILDAASSLLTTVDRTVSDSQRPKPKTQRHNSNSSSRRSSDSSNYYPSQASSNDSNSPSINIETPSFGSGNDFGGGGAGGSW